MKKLTSVLAFAALLGFGSSVLADETTATDDQATTATATPSSSDDSSDSTGSEG